MLSTWYAGARVDGFLTLLHLYPDSSVQTRPPPQWCCAPTPRFQAISRLNRRSIPTPASFMPLSWVTQHSAFASGSWLDRSSRHSPTTDLKPVTMYSITLHSYQKRRGHASAPTKQLQTLSMSKPTRRIRKRLLTKPHRDQHLRLWQHQQHMVHLQT